MKKIVAYCFFFSAVFSARAQYYFKGTVRDEKSNPLQKAKIYVHSSKTVYAVETDGRFNIPTKFKADSISISLIGYENKSLKINSDLPAYIILKLLPETIIKYRPKLTSSSKDKKETTRFNPLVSDETYFKLIENEFVKTDNFPKTAFALNVNKASYSNVRRFINMQSKVPPDAVRVEEMINYFNLGYTSPIDKEIFNLRSSIIPCPWHKTNKLLCLKISAKQIDLKNIPPGNFVFLIDVSGSMDLPNRLPLLKEAFQLFVTNLRAIDKVSIVTYGGTVGTWLQPTFGNEKEKIINSLELLQAAGDTPGESAIVAAYKLASANFLAGGNNRIILATDGDFNVGQTSEKALDELIIKQRESGIYLTCLGVGMGNFKDSKLQILSKRGNGNYAYLDNLHEAEKVLVQELTETLYAVADNAFVNVVFNSSQVNSYRLIGFDNKREAVQDAGSDLDGGEIGSGGTTMALFEIVPSPQYDSTFPVATLNLKFHDAQNKKFALIEKSYAVPLLPNDTFLQPEKFAAIVAMYGLKLKGSAYLNGASWSALQKAAEAVADKNIFLQNDFLKLLQKSIDIYEPQKKRKLFRKISAE